jgi:bis(5'-nucleosyl)-tetraphosphatase (symmetrical)
MATYAIGDLQGCYDELMRLLDRIHFDPGKDHLWFAGDIVNRGPKSLQALRFIKALGKQAIVVLGNHDLHLLALSQGNTRLRDRDHSLDPVLRAKDRDELLYWLRNRPLIYHNQKEGFSLVHAGLPPQWDAQTARARAREVEKRLRGDGFPDFCLHMYGNQPVIWSDKLKGMERLRFITNCFTRLRYCNQRGRLALKEKGPPGSQPRGIMPWYAIPGRASRNDRILFGHWSTLGYLHTDNVWALDSGCLWGGKLTALKLKRDKPPKVIQLSCPGASSPKSSK